MDSSGDMPKPLSRRYFAVLDALEEYRLLRELLDTIDDALLRAESRWPRGRSQPFFTVVSMPDAVYRPCYFEVSWGRAIEASRAVEDAARTYEYKFDAATLTIADLHVLFRQLGFPHPADIKRAARYRHLYEPTWRRMFNNRHRRELRTRWPIVEQRPESDEFTFHCLNDPDPWAYVAYWRESADTDSTT